MSLIERFKQQSKQYYDSIYFDFMEEITEERAYSFIESYFLAGKKKRVFDIDFMTELKREGKHIHTVMLYFLGCEVSTLITQDLESDLKERVKSIDEWYDFKYVWFLTCLYHDTASSIEKINYKDAELDIFLQDNGVDNDVFRHKALTENISLEVFSEGIVRNYFRYKIQHRKSVDHGILGGYILFDRLYKNYEEAFKEMVSRNGQQRMSNSSYSHDYFVYNDRSWRIEQLDLFALIAHSIIAHNIWFSYDSKLYKEYSLESLILPRTNRIKKQEHPLYFFLALLDTIEPTKRFSDILADRVLEKIDIYIEGYKLIIEVLDIEQLKQSKGYEGKSNYDTWIKGIKCLSNWLEVTVDINEDEGKIIINTNEENMQ